MTLSEFLLMLTPLLPLLLAMPWLRRLVPGFEYVAILPALLLLIFAEQSVLELPSLLLGSGLGFAEQTSLLLLMAILLWLPAAFYLSVRMQSSDGSLSSEIINQRYSTFFLLTLSGYLATILAIDVVGFFTFSTLMGYSFYALLINGSGDSVKRAALVYLCFLIVADLLLFEAALIAVVATDNLSFAAVRDANLSIDVVRTAKLNFAAVHAALPTSSYAPLYLSMVVLGFALKAGFWPVYFWLPLAFRAATPPTTLLIGGVPVAIALLGILRWLPLGYITLPLAGRVVQFSGVAAVLFSLLYVLIRREPKTLPAQLTLLATGLFTVMLGIGLNKPDLWQQYGHLAYSYIVFLSLGLALLTVVIAWRQGGKQLADKSMNPTEARVMLIERGSETVVRRIRTLGMETLPRLRASSRATAQYYLHVPVWKKALKNTELILQRWSFAITLLVLLGIIFVLVVINI